MPRTILITGASSGIGLCTAEKLSSDSRLVLTGRSESKLKALLEKLARDNHISFPMDLSNEAEFAKMADAIPSLDGIVLSAGIVEYKPFKFVKRVDFDSMFWVNFLSQLLLVKEILKKGKLNDGASILFISSISSILGVPATITYASSKAAINASVRVLATELSKKKIRVNSILPGIVVTPMIENDVMNQMDKGKIGNLYPLGIGQPEYIANTIRFFMSNDSYWITGQNLVIDGGYSLTRE